MSTELAKMQELLVEVLVNPVAYRAFASDPEAFGRASGLDAGACQKLRAFRANEISTFRDIVGGTRALRFAELLPRTRRHLGDDWRRYITRFFESVAIRDSRLENDTRQFVEFLERECEDRRIRQCARLELTVLLLSNESAAHAAGGSIDLVLDCDLASLLSEDLADIRPAPESQYRFTRNSESGEIDMFLLESTP